jgi:cellulose synthase/poly-beta-1,6-N-acetylglucosamine synthase-like glycosyltransferase
VRIYRNTRGVTRYTRELNACQQNDAAWPPVTVVVNTFNEAKVIRRKLESLADLNYPTEQLEVLVVDDCSHDDTGGVAERALAAFGLPGRVLRTPVRLGLNASLNLAFQEAGHDVVCVTDSDVILEANALARAVRVLQGVDGAGGVTGKIEPLLGKEGMASSSEGSYRVFYDRSMLSESAVHSCFPGNGPLIMFDRSLVRSSIPVAYGSSDGNIAMNIVKSGKRLLYVPDAVIFEPVPDTMGQQRLQKVRRARRLIQVFLHNVDVWGKQAYGAFGTLIFPLKFLIHVVCPLLTVIGVAAVVGGVLLSGIFWIQLCCAGVLAVLGGVLVARPRVRQFFLSFVVHQMYLLAGLFSSFRKSVFWKTIERT